MPPSFDLEGLAPGEVQAFVLAGGRSSRMGQDKARLQVRGVPLALHVARRFAAAVVNVWLVGKRDSGLEDLGLPVLYDAATQPALVHGIQAALQAPGPGWRLVLACDMPGVDVPVLQELWRCARAAGAPGACVRLSGSAAPEPVPSLWHADVAPVVRPEWGLAARDWVRHAGLAVLEVAPGAGAGFENLNTPQDWARWTAETAAQAVPS